MGEIGTLFQMDSLGFWNVRGINSPQKHCDVRWFLNHHVCGLFRLLETRVKADNFGKVFPRICSKWSVVTNYTCHKGGRIWLVWLPSRFVVDVILSHAQLIHCKVMQKGTGKVFRLTIVYGFNSAEERKLFGEYWKLSVGILQVYRLCVVISIMCSI